MKTVLGVLIIFAVSCNVPDSKFNATVWKSNRMERQKMATDLIKQELLTGKSTNEVIEILGQNDIVSGSNSIQYVLGSCTANIDFERLEIQFQYGLVTKARIICD